jgi:hypothetical protein
VTTSAFLFLQDDVSGFGPAKEAIDKIRALGTALLKQSERKAFLAWLMSRQGDWDLLRRDAGN